MVIAAHAVKSIEQRALAQGTNLIERRLLGGLRGRAVEVGFGERCCVAGCGDGVSGSAQSGVRVLRVEDDVVGRAALDDDALVEHHDLVAEVPGGGEVVGDVEHAEVLLALQVGEQVQHAEPDRHVEHRHRLVGDEQRRARARARGRSRRAGAGRRRARAGGGRRTASGVEPHPLEQAHAPRSSTSSRGNRPGAGAAGARGGGGSCGTDSATRTGPGRPSAPAGGSARSAAPRRGIGAPSSRISPRGRRLELGEDLGDRRLAAAALADQRDRAARGRG